MIRPVGLFFNESFLGVIVYWMLYTIITCSFLYIVRRVIGGWRLKDFNLRLSEVKEVIICGVVVPTPLFIIQCIAALIAVNYILA